MAFNFNWSPLIADTSRARDMLTTALNKSPKPPIIVDDILVTELNLGSTPPELEILEIGDLAEDRFRGIFKMSYTGDAFLTLKTKVQANPLNTYLSAKPSFASPQPLSAASGLTIPLQITLSDIRLSGFVILVFSRQKGLTLVFRNDPLESLKVSSTFDSIPFVRDYLQKEIEKQLRVLFMEDLPAIIHRLSLQLWSPEYQELKERLDSSNDDTAPVDPLATPPQDAVDAFGNPLDDSQISSLSLEPTSEIHASFSQKNILRLAALSESHKTLSLFTPSIRDTVFRAWASTSERGDHSGTNTPALTISSLSRIQSTFASTKSAPASLASGSTGDETTYSRPTLQNFSSQYGSTLGVGRSRAHPMRKRKKRVVNLRRDTNGGDSSGVSTEASTPIHSAQVSETASVIPEEKEEDLATPPRSPAKHLRFENRHGSLDVGRPAHLSEQMISEPTMASVPALLEPPKPSKSKGKAPAPTPVPAEKPKNIRSSTSRPPLRHAQTTAATPLLRSLSMDKLPFHQSTSSMSSASSTSGGILEQAWMLKMAQEIARKVQDEKEKAAAGGIWDRREEDEMDAPPPAYVA